MSAPAPKSHWLVEAPGLWSLPLWPAFGFWRRWRGRAAAPGSAVLLRTRSIHGWGACVPIPVLVVNERGVVGDVRLLLPRRVLAWRAPSWVLELPPGRRPPQPACVLRLRRIVR